MVAPYFKKLIFFIFFYYFDVLILKIKKIILMHFSMKSTLKNNRNYTPKQVHHVFESSAML